MAIWRHENYQKLQGTYPVISISFAGVKENSFLQACKALCRIIKELYNQFEFLLKGTLLNESEKEDFRNISVEMEDNAASVSLRSLSDYLSRYYGRNVIILLDEYDTPMQEACVNGYWNELAGFVRSLFNATFKTNPYMERAILTGITRISRESIFSDLNNLEVVTTTSDKYETAFGFTETEVFAALEEYGLPNRREEVREWYDGFSFGRKKDIYNPWSIINYVKTSVSRPTAFPSPYWSNTSSNSVIREMIERADTLAKEDLEELLAGGTIEKPIHEEITYGDIYESQDNLWNFLFFTGYLKAVSQRFEEGTVYLTMRIPNTEVKCIYRNSIQDWFRENIRKVDFQPFYQALQAQDTERMEAFLNGQLSFSISYHDEGEKFYHGYLMGVIGGLKGYKILSNRE